MKSLQKLYSMTLTIFSNLKQIKNVHISEIETARATQKFAGVCCKFWHLPSNSA